MRVPTKQIEAHADKQRFKPATRRFFPAIYRQAKDYYQTFIIDFRLLNDEIAKTRDKKGFCRGTLNYVREQIINSPAIKVVRQYSSYIFELQIIPFSDCEKNERTEKKLTLDDLVAESPNIDQDLDLALKSEDTGIDQQQLIATVIELESVDIKYQRKDLPKIACYGIEAVKKAVTMFKTASLTSKIHNPEGWLRRCLQRKWYLNYKESDSAYPLLDLLVKVTDKVLLEFGTLPSVAFENIMQLLKRPSEEILT